MHVDTSQLLSEMTFASFWERIFPRTIQILRDRIDELILPAGAFSTFFRL
jgi:hypothetical protein